MNARWFPWSIANSIMLQVQGVGIMRDLETLLELDDIFGGGYLDCYKCNGEVIYRGRWSSMAYEINRVFLNIFVLVVILRII